MPLGYEVFAGNRVDVTALREITETMGRRYGRADRIWVGDRGMVSADNIAFLKQSGRRYIIGTSKSTLKQFERQLLAEDWHTIRARPLRAADRGGPATHCAELRETTFGAAPRRPTRGPASRPKQPCGRSVPDGGQIIPRRPRDLAMEKDRAMAGLGHEPRRVFDELGMVGELGLARSSLCHFSIRADLAKVPIMLCGRLNCSQPLPPRRMGFHPPFPAYIAQLRPLTSVGSSPILPGLEDGWFVVVFNPPNDRTVGEILVRPRPWLSPSASPPSPSTSHPGGSAMAGSCKSPPQVRSAHGH